MAERIAEAPQAPDRTKELRRALGTWLKQGREAKGLTQAELAERLGLRYYSFISQVENGIGRIPQDLYGPWAAALDIEGPVFAMTVLEHIEPGLHALLTPAPAPSRKVQEGGKSGRRRTK
ncbi:MAG: helix-turn-helix domain-containing protein [Alphaproteobacteria bacterium]